MLVTDCEPESRQGQQPCCAQLSASASSSLASQALEVPISGVVIPSFRKSSSIRPCKAWSSSVRFATNGQSSGLFSFRSTQSRKPNALALPGQLPLSIVYLSRVALTSPPRQCPTPSSASSEHALGILARDQESSVAVPFSPQILCFSFSYTCPTSKCGHNPII